MLSLYDNVSCLFSAEYGDYVEEDFGIGPGYLKSLKLLPNQTEEIEAKIMGHHREHLYVSFSSFNEDRIASLFCPN